MHKIHINNELNYILTKRIIRKIVFLLEMRNNNNKYISQINDL